MISGRCWAIERTPVNSGSLPLLLFGADGNSGGRRLLLLLRYVPASPSAGDMIMTGSLKAYAPVLAWRLGTTPAALYERQRTLVRDVILHHPGGRGPGSGVQLVPYQVALLLLAVLATDSLTETGKKVKILAKAKSTADNGICPLTGESTFAEAVARVLDPTCDHWRGIVSITVHRTEGIGVISYNEALRSGGSVFAGPKQRGQLGAPTRLRVDATLTRDLIIAIAIDLKKDAETEQRARAAALEGVAGSEQRIRPHGRRRRSVKQPRL